MKGQDRIRPNAIYKYLGFPLSPMFSNRPPVQFRQRHKRDYRFKFFQTIQVTICTAIALDNVRCDGSIEENAWHQRDFFFRRRVPSRSILSTSVSSSWRHSRSVSSKPSSSSSAGQPPNICSMGFRLTPCSAATSSIVLHGGIECGGGFNEIRFRGTSRSLLASSSTIISTRLPINGFNSGNRSVSDVICLRMRMAFIVSPAFPSAAMIVSEYEAKRQQINPRPHRACPARPGRRPAALPPSRYCASASFSFLLSASPAACAYA